MMSQYNGLLMNKAYVPSGSGRELPASSSTVSCESVRELASSVRAVIVPVNTSVQHKILKRDRHNQYLHGDACEQQ